MDIIISFIFLGIVIAMYFAPTIVAQRTGHKNTTAIGVANALFGWTFIGWGVCLIAAVYKGGQ